MWLWFSRVKKLFSFLALTLLWNFKKIRYNDENNFIYDFTLDITEVFCFRSLPTQNVKLVVDITVIGAFSNGRAKNYDSDNFIGNATEYEVGKHWQFDSLSLYQTKIPIAFTNNKVRSINLPKGKELNEWKDPYKIPNNSDFSVIYWCRPSVSKLLPILLKQTNKIFLFAWDQMYRIDNFLYLHN